MRLPELIITQSQNFQRIRGFCLFCRLSLQLGCREMAAVAIDGPWSGNREKHMRAWFGVALVAALLAGNAGASAQSYPDRPVRMVIAFPAGGTIDTLGRILAQKLTEAWGENVVIENRPGGGGNIGAAAAAKAAPDGYTLHFGAQTLAVNVTLQPSKEFDPVKDFDPIMLVATAQDVLLVPPTSPFRSVKELTDYAKGHPGELNYASLGTG